MISEPECHAAVLLEESGVRSNTVREIAEAVDCENKQLANDLGREDLTDFLP